MWVEFLHIFSGSFLDAKVGQTTVQIYSLTRLHDLGLTFRGSLSESITWSIV